MSKRLIYMQDEILKNQIFLDHSLSWRAKGIYSQLLFLTDDEEWSPSTDGLSCQAKEGKSAFHTALRELEETGYLIRTRRRNEEGLFGSVENNLWVLLDHPGLYNEAVRFIEGKGYVICSKRKSTENINRPVEVATEEEKPKPHQDFSDLYALCNLHSEEDCRFFDELMTIDGVGARIAVNVVCANGITWLKKTIEEGDTAALIEIHGVGDDIAEKMIQKFGGSKRKSVSCVECGGETPHDVDDTTKDDGDVQDLSETDDYTLLDILMGINGMTELTAKRLLHAIDIHDLRRYVVSDNVAAISNKAFITKTLAKTVVARLKDFEGELFLEEDELIGAPPPEELPDAPLVVEDAATDVADAFDVSERENSFIKPDQLSCSVAGWENLSIR